MGYIKRSPRPPPAKTPPEALPINHHILKTGGITTGGDTTARELRPGNGGRSANGAAYEDTMGSHNVVHGEAYNGETQWEGNGEKMRNVAFMVGK